MRRILLITAFVLTAVAGVLAQGVTTSSITGRVRSSNGEALPGASVIAVHEPSGTKYGTATLADGRYSIPGMRVGGPYSVTISFVGYETQKIENVSLVLGVATNLNIDLKEEGTQLGEVVVTADKTGVFSSDRTGAATSIGRESINSLPTISRRIGDFTRLTPQASGNSFAGQDNRLNNITVDGSYFNNSFGLAGQPGERTNVSPISLDAIEQIQVNIAPYDVRQGNFVGAGINTVTRSGTNKVEGSVYYLFRNDNMVGTKAKDLSFSQGKFDYKQFGARVGAPIIKDKLFIFTSFEKESLVEPGTTFVANNGSQAVAGNVTRVLASDLDGLSTYLNQNFDYQTGPYQGYDHETGATKFLVKLDYNLNDRNKISIRYNHLDSDTDVLVSTSSSLGFGNRRGNLNALNFQNSNYKILENIRSIIGEWNTRIGDNMANNLIIGYTFQDESRGSRGSFFPLVEILEGTLPYTTFGFEPFTPNNELRYKTFQLQNNFTMYKGDHTLTFGLSFERYESENVFFPGSQSVYVYNSLADFYTDANDFLANPNRTSSPVGLRRFQVRYANIPGMVKPVQPLEVIYAGIYGQDEWKVNSQLTLTAGLRIDVPKFGDTGFRNTDVEAMDFIDENGNTKKYRTDRLPDAKPLFSPRLGFNYDLKGDRSTQIRGGTGIFTSRPAYVWISNQIGNNGILTGFYQGDNIAAGTEIVDGGRPFNPNPNAYKPGTVTGTPAPSYELALTETDFKFPQIWRTNIALDQKLPLGITGTFDFIYSKDVNGVYYVNANLAETDATFNGADDRPLYPGGTPNRINSNITSAVVLKNQNVGYSYSVAASLERPFSNGFFAKVGYNYGVAKNTVDPGSIAFGSWNNNQHAGDPNNPGVGFSANASAHRVFAAASYTNKAGTAFSIFWEGRTIGNASYVYSGDLNRDGGTSNDLIYIPRNTSEMNFEQYTASGRTFTVAEQEAAWEAYIKQDKYLSKNRGKYAERGGVFLPMVFRADFSMSQDIVKNIGENKNTLQIRMDILNVGNLLNRDWGVSQRLISTTPLVVRPAANGGPVDANGEAIYRLQNVGNLLLGETAPGETDGKSYQQTLDVNDVFRIQFGVRYIFN
ncbi:MAG: TonB-dependent receptor [Cyclobacteriaceae bacterium]|nr:TonB-dependent receptor [Cyclobacteriaceae bacterium]